VRIGADARLDEIDREALIGDCRRMRRELERQPTVNQILGEAVLRGLWKVRAGEGGLVEITRYAANVERIAGRLTSKAGGKRAAMWQSNRAGEQAAPAAEEES
jgi:hypothetical protein